MAEPRYTRQRTRRVKNTKTPCPECTNAIFDEIMGEYKCKVYKHKIHDPDSRTDCKDYKKV
jgi:hypothetical protein